jgi:hypothetical protein
MSVLVRVPKDIKEVTDALQIVENLYQERGYVKRFLESNNPFLFFTVYVEDVLCGGGALIYPTAGTKRFPTEEYFQFDLSKATGLRIDRRHVVELGRLGLTDPTPDKIALKAWFVACWRYACQHGIKWACFSLKPWLFRYLSERLKIPIHQIPNVVPQPRFIPEEYSGYFLNSNPAPYAAYLVTKEIQKRMQELEREISGGAIIEINGQTPRTIELKKQVIVP